MDRQFEDGCSEVLFNLDSVEPSLCPWNFLPQSLLLAPLQSIQMMMF